jgi:4-hydroxy-tetrahydrodipicolinate synthase
MPISDTRPWRGLYTATALPFNDDLSVDYDSYAEHVQWLAASHTDGVYPSGSLGEYQTLTEAERARVVEVAVEAAPAGFGVMPGASAYGSYEAVRWVEQAAKAGAQSVLLLPPTSYPANRDAVLAHYREAAAVGIPIVAYNNPGHTNVDMTPEVLAELHAEGLIKAVKDFSGEPRRAYQMSELAPELDLLVGADDVMVELALSGGVKGWIAGYPNVFPETSVRLYGLATSGDHADLAAAVRIYRDLHPLLRWDSREEFIQAIKLSMDVVGRKGGVTRPPRLPMSEPAAALVRRQTEAVVAKGYR